LAGVWSIPKDSELEGFGRASFEGRTSVSESDAGKGDARGRDLYVPEEERLGLMTRTRLVGDGGDEGGEYVWLELGANVGECLFTGVEARPDRCLAKELSACRVCFER
jgi:hypothetical protein